MSYRDHLAGHVRLALLQALEAAPGYSASAELLGDIIHAAGFRVAADLVGTELAWLCEQGLLSLEVLPRGVSVATLSPRGADVAAGRAIVPGVRRPGP
ncbi:MAG: hypothetical protein SNJ79_01430 [Sphingomonadaceae bacterium]